MDKHVNSSNTCSHSLPNLDSANTVNSTKPSTVMVTYPISEEPGISNLAFDSNEDLTVEVDHSPISDTEYLCHPGSSSTTPTTVTPGLGSHHQITTTDNQCAHHSVGTLVNGNAGVNRESNLGSHLYSTQSCDFDVVPVFSLTGAKSVYPNENRRISQTTRIVISTSLISFGITIMIVGILVYTVRDIEIGFNPGKFNHSGSITNTYEAYLVHQTVDSILSDERRYNASVGSMFMSFGGLSVIIGISLLLAPAIKKRQPPVTSLRSSADGKKQNASSIVYFNKDDLNASQMSVEKIDLDHHGSKREFF
uniref:Uncharacterized protein n=1 Tax=Tetranychus urticae TaxID=32264 RepID=T1KHB4_TETUR